MVANSGPSSGAIGRACAGAGKAVAAAAPTAAMVTSTRLLNCRGGIRVSPLLVSGQARPLGTRGDRQLRRCLRSSAPGVPGLRAGVASDVRAVCGLTPSAKLVAGCVTGVTHALLAIKLAQASGAL